MKSIKLTLKHGVHIYVLYQVDSHVLGSYDIRCQFKGFANILQSFGILKGHI